MKRHPSLQDLSREHHLILVHARELRWAAKGHGDLPKTCLEFLDYWKKRGTRHMEQEEKKLFPYCEKCNGWKKTESVDLVFQQHHQIRALITTLEESVEQGRDLLKPCENLSELLERNIRHEERVVFQEIQGALTETEMTKLKRLLHSCDRVS